MSSEPTPSSRPNQGERRRENRVAAVQCLYMWEQNKRSLACEELQDRFFALKADHKPSYFKFASELIEGTLANIKQIDASIAQFASNWSIERIARVDLSVLRLALYELMHREDIPPVVSINEAIELGKLLSDEDSKRFINGVLDRFKLTLTRPLRTAVQKK